MNIGNITGYNNIYKVAKDQGLFSKVLNINYEQYGILNMDPLDNGDISLLSIGEKFRITPLEAISLPNTIINNGVYVKPTIIEGFVQGDKIVKSEETVQKQVISKKTAEIMKEQMRKVVSDVNGTGKLAAVRNNDVGGKTGTATRQEAKETHSDGWFVGFFEYNGKYYSAVVQVPDINNTNEEGGTTAAPIFKKIVESLNYQN